MCHIRFYSVFSSSFTYYEITFSNNLTFFFRSYVKSKRILKWQFLPFFISNFGAIQWKTIQYLVHDDKKIVEGNLSLIQFLSNIMPKAKYLYICKGWHSIAYNFFTSLFLFQLNICEFNDSTSLATYLHKFSVVVQIMHFFGKIWEKFVLDLVLIYYWNFFKNYTKTASSNGANGKEFGEQHQQQRIKKAPYFMPD